MHRRLLVPSGEPLAPIFLVGRLFRHFADETVHIGPPVANGQFLAVGGVLPMIWPCELFKNTTIQQL
jgi:hypothetical protein